LFDVAYIAAQLYAIPAHGSVGKQQPDKEIDIGSRTVEPVTQLEPDDFK